MVFATRQRAFPGKNGLSALINYAKIRIRAKKVPIGMLRCQEKEFSALQGFSGKPIEYFPPYRFFETALRDRDGAFRDFCNWLRLCLVERKAWEVPKSKGGWADGSLVQAILRLHLQRGTDIEDLSTAIPELVELAVQERARYYLNLFDSINDKGYVRMLGYPVTCWQKGHLYYINNGHHRASILGVLGYNRVEVITLGQR